MNQYTRRRPSSSNRWISILLYYVLPFIVINGIIFLLVTSSPRCQLTIGETNDYLTTTATLKIKSLLPIKEMTVSISGEELELESKGKREYTANITKNGTIEVYLKGLNGMSSLSYGHVSILDDTPPIISNTDVESGILTFIIDDSQTGVDYTSIYATDSTGATHQPLSIDKTTASVSFEMDSNGLNIFAKDLAGNEVQAHFNSQTEDVEGTVEGENT